MAKIGRISILQILVAIICVFSNIDSYSQNRKFVNENIRGIIIKSQHAMFDNDVNREFYSQSTCRIGNSIITDSATIKLFTEILNQRRDVLGVTCNPYDAEMQFKSLRNSGKIISDVVPWLNPYARIIIYYKNGSLPELMWVNMGRIDGAGFITEDNQEIYNFIESLDMSMDDDVVADTIACWEKEKPMVDSINSISVFYLKPFDASISRTELIDKIETNSLYCNKIVDKKIISDIIKELNELIYVKTLDYNTASTGVRGHIGNSGNVEWESESDKVRALIIINHDDITPPELIWITDYSIERGYYKYRKSDYFYKMIRG